MQRGRGPPVEDFSSLNRHRGAVGVAVVVDRLAKESHFQHPNFGEFPTLHDDVIWRAVNFSPAGVGHHAIGAELVASTGDSDVGRSAA